MFNVCVRTFEAELFSSETVALGAEFFRPEAAEVGGLDVACQQCTPGKTEVYRKLKDSKSSATYVTEQGI